MLFRQVCQLNPQEDRVYLLQVNLLRDKVHHLPFRVLHLQDIVYLHLNKSNLQLQLRKVLLLLDK